MTDDTNDTEATIPTITSAEQLAEMMKARFLSRATDFAVRADPEKLMQSVMQDMNAQKEKITLRLLGIDKWGEVKDDSFLSRYIDEHGKSLVSEWVKEAVTKVFTENLKTKVMKDAEKAVKEKTRSFAYGVSSALEEQVKQLHLEVMLREINKLRAELSLEPITLSALKSASRW